MDICLERGADLHMAQLMLGPLTVSGKIPICFAFLVPAYLGTVVLDKGPLNGRVCGCAENVCDITSNNMT